MLFHVLTLPHESRYSYVIIIRVILFYSGHVLMLDNLHTPVIVYDNKSPRWKCGNPGWWFSTLISTSPLPLTPWFFWNWGSRPKRSAWSYTLSIETPGWAMTMCAGFVRHLPLVRVLFACWCCRVIVPGSMRGSCLVCVCVCVFEGGGILNRRRSSTSKSGTEYV